MGKKIYGSTICYLCWHIIDNCRNNPEKLSATKINKHAASAYLLFRHCSFDATKNKHDYYRGKAVWKTFAKT